MSDRDLTKEEVGRYSRQVILPEIGADGQKKLIDASVLIVGAGGLGSSAGLYLAGAGVGTIGFVDFDQVETSNLHRQIIHATDRSGSLKVESAKSACLSLNPLITVNAINSKFTSETGLDLVRDYDVIIDATDNVTSRYLINDSCVISGKPLVSGSALRWEGQLSVYNHNNGPCYRCVYPSPPPTSAVTSCADGGVVGAVPGMIGTLQAIEAQKIICEIPTTMSGRILLFDALAMSHTTMNHRPRNPSCAVCGTSPTITKLIAYEQYLTKPCDSGPPPLPQGTEISVRDLKDYRDQQKDHLLLDVRSETEYGMTRLNNSINIPLKKLSPSDVANIRTNESQPILVLCRRGIASVSATQKLIDAGIPNVFNVSLGLTQWAKEIDLEFPIY
eukprot:TRINITY_DN8966_c0_g1_i1.p1 TRINITY_DN8966_c0_g1~~TRINITY_DN8966_c0_g1_i1.p1  ORF type:complete len:406 (+),score=53.33 TRINITY_DN8966_c0_g1_i1:54-1220(+)